MTATPARGPKLPPGNIAWGDFDPTTDLATTTWNDKTQWCRNTRPVMPTKGGDPKRAPSAKLVLWALVDHSDPYGVSYANQGTIAKECSIVPRTVSTALAALEEQGLILRFHRHDRAGYRTSDVIILTLCLDASTASRDVHLDATDDITYMQLTQDLDATDDTPRCNSCIAEELPSVNHPVLTTQVEPTTETRVALFETSPVPAPKNAPPDERFETFWNAYPKRKGKRAGKQAAVKAWKRMNATERDTAEQNLAHYLDYLERPDADYACNAATYLNGRYTDWDEPADPTPQRPATKHDRQDLDIRAAQLRAAAKQTGIGVDALQNGDTAKALAAHINIAFDGLAGYHGYIGHPTGNGHTLETTARQLTQGDT